MREGWDNPNVFQICTLNETHERHEETAGDRARPASARRPERARVFDESVNKLYVMANESYEDFARALQTEYEEDCGVTFGKVPLTALAKLTRVVDGQEQPIGRDAAAGDPHSARRAEDARRRWTAPASLRPEEAGTSSSLFPRTTQI